MIIDGIEIGFLQIIFITIMVICALLLAREVRTWYWKINTIIKYQEEQLDQMDMLIGEISVQNKLLLRIVEQIEPVEEPTEPEDEESTP